MSQDGGDVTGGCPGRVTEPKALRDKPSPWGSGARWCPPGSCYGFSSGTCRVVLSGAPVSTPRLLNLRDLEKGWGGRAARFHT